MTLPRPQKPVNLYSVGHGNLIDVGGYYVQISSWNVLFVFFSSVENIFIAFI
jgi:hypothetical protein